MTNKIIKDPLTGKSATPPRGYETVEVDKQLTKEQEILNAVFTPLVPTKPKNNDHVPLLLRHLKSAQQNLARETSSYIGKERSLYLEAAKELSSYIESLERRMK